MLAKTSIKDLGLQRDPTSTLAN